MLVWARMQTGEDCTQEQFRLPLGIAIEPPNKAIWLGWRSVTLSPGAARGLVIGFWLAASCRLLFAAFLLFRFARHGLSGLCLLPLPSCFSPVSNFREKLADVFDLCFRPHVNDAASHRGDLRGWHLAYSNVMGESVIADPQPFRSFAG